MTTTSPDRDPFRAKRAHLFVLAGRYLAAAIPRGAPLWWDRATFDAIKSWKRLGVEPGALESDRFVVSVIDRVRGKTLSRQALRQRFRTACQILGTSRLESLSIYDGRNTFVNHALARGRSLAELRGAAAHANIVTASADLHTTLTEHPYAGQLFGCGSDPAVR